MYVDDKTLRTENKKTKQRVVCEREDAIIIIVSNEDQYRY